MSWRLVLKLRFKEARAMRILNFILLFLGGVSEGPKEHAWKACVRVKPTVGSNPTSSDTWDDLTLLLAYQTAHAVL